MMAKHFFFPLVSGRFHFIQVLEILILLISDFGSVKVFRQKQVSVMPRVRLRQIVLLFLIFVSDQLRHITCLTDASCMPSFKYIIAVEHKSMAVRVAGWCTVARGRIILFIAGNNAAHRAGKSANDVNVYITITCISRLN